MRKFSLIDNILNEIDTIIRTIIPPQQRIIHRYLFSNHKQSDDYLSPPEKKHVAGLMRVNHVGEVCAQALYQGQGLITKSRQIKEQLQQAAQDEVEHLAWCEQRLRELHSKCSIFNPLWYSGSLCIGVIMGACGDQWSMGFIAETETQVAAHLQQHLQLLPKQDKKTRVIIENMYNDELQHANMANLSAHNKQLPLIFRKIMKITAKCMTTISYYI